MVTRNAMATRNTNDLDSDAHFAVLCSVAETLSESVMITDAGDWAHNPTILYVNPAFSRLTGYSKAEVLGQTPKILQGKMTERSVLGQLWRELASRDAWKGMTYNYTKSRQPFLMEWEIVPIHDTAGCLRFHLTVQRKMEEKVDRAQGRNETMRRWNEVFS